MLFFCYWKLFGFDTAGVRLYYDFTDGIVPTLIISNIDIRN